MNNKLTVAKERYVSTAPVAGATSVIKHGMFGGNLHMPR